MPEPLLADRDQPVAAAPAVEPPVTAPVTVAASEPIAAEPAPSTGEARVPIRTRIKHFLLRAIDLSALGFLEPVVRLCYGEEPRVQLRKIGRFVLVPVIAIVLFIGLWQVMSEHIRTKSGKLPSPAVTWDAAVSILTFHERENHKEVAYEFDGEQRAEALAEAEARLAVVGEAIVAAEAAVAAAEASKREALAESFEPVRERYESAKDQVRAEQDRREAELLAQAEAIAVDDQAAKGAFVDAVRAHQARAEDEEAELAVIKERMDAIMARDFPVLAAAQAELTVLAEERQYLRKLVDIYADDGRAAKVAGEEERLARYRAAIAGATGADLLRQTQRLIAGEERMAATLESSYAKPMTLPMQVWRSILCVFAGFLLGSLIAIPIGICCGLSSTFMAAMMPFIALFKPVSPIVWLPIALIVVSGTIPDPDGHWLIGLVNAPLPEWIGINPAFIASAITVALCSLWATMVNTALGVASVDKDHLNVARVLRLGFWSRLFKIILPSALPLIFAGLRISLGIGWMVLIAAELLSSSEGIGKYVWDMFNNGSSDSFAKMFVVVFVVGFIGLILDRIMIVFQRLVSFEGSVAAI